MVKEEGDMCNLDITHYINVAKNAVIFEEHELRILKEIIEELQLTAKAKNIYFKFEKPEKKLPAINADPEKLKVALTNIFDNAIKYTTKGEVIIKIQILDKKLRIISKDTGIGISQEDKENLFSGIFERGEEAQKVFTTGRGIGLYIASQIIQAHNGKVWAESAGHDKGSTFFIVLPTIWMSN